MIILKKRTEKNKLKKKENRNAAIVINKFRANIKIRWKNTLNYILIMGFLSPLDIRFINFDCNDPVHIEFLHTFQFLTVVIYFVFFILTRVTHCCQIGSFGWNNELANIQWQQSTSTKFLYCTHLMLIERTANYSSDGQFSWK